jgi:sporulation protein YlmC with PRC-barrel domain
MRTRMWLTVAVATLVCAWSVRAMADDPAGTPSTTSGQSSTTGGSENAFFGSSQLTKLHAYDGQNENLGKIDDLIIDAHTGQILYGILDTGMFGKNIPVPWQALQVRITDNKYWYYLNKSKHDLANAPTFSRSHWPSFADMQWRQSVDKFFGVRTVARPVEPTSESQSTQGTRGLTAEQMILPSSRLADLNVYNKKDVKLGNVDNLIVDIRTGQVLYGIMDTGFGGHKVPAPWGAFWLGKEVNRDSYWLVMDKSKDQLANAPTFDPKHWPDFTSSQWRTTVDNFFGVRTASHQQPGTNR